jgi:hypothetical protein
LFPEAGCGALIRAADDPLNRYTAPTSISVPAEPPTSTPGAPTAAAPSSNATAAPKRSSSPLPSGLKKEAISVP